MCFAGRRLLSLRRHGDQNRVAWVMNMLCCVDGASPRGIGNGELADPAFHHRDPNMQEGSIIRIVEGSHQA